jgi:hypothetical protein
MTYYYNPVSDVALLRPVSSEQSEIQPHRELSFA